jgi:hypothetical protein
MANAVDTFRAALTQLEQEQEKCREVKAENEALGEQVAELRETTYNLAKDMRRLENKVRVSEQARKVADQERDAA